MSLPREELRRVTEREGHFRRVLEKEQEFARPGQVSQVDGL